MAQHKSIALQTLLQTCFKAQGLFSSGEFGPRERPSDKQLLGTNLYVLYCICMSMSMSIAMYCVAHVGINACVRCMHVFVYMLIHVRKYDNILHITIIYVKYFIQIHIVFGFESG